MAQNTATVRGTIADPDGAVIPGAAITMTPATGAALHATSQPDGTYTLRNVPAGTYTMLVTATGFANFTQTAIQVTTGQFLNLDAKLTIEMTQETVQVTANDNSLSVDADSNASSTVITGDALDALSDDPDELESELQALAGPSAGPDGGQIYIDGFTGGQLPPKSSIREIRINQNPFSAEFDRPGFGRVQVFTKPGTDKLRGNISFQGNTSAINTGNPLLNISATTGQPVPNPISQPGYYTLFSNGNVTGPLTKLSSFSIGGSYRHNSDNSIIKATILAPTSGSSTLCAPGQAGCFISTYNQAAPNSQDRWNISPRIDAQLGARNTLTARLGFFKSSQSASGNNLSLNTTGATADSTEETLQLGDTQTVSSSVINETRFEYQRDLTESVPTNPVAQINVQGNFRGGGSGGGGNQTHSNHIEVQNYTSIALSKNFIRLGGRLRWDNQSVGTQSGNAGSFTYAFLTTEGVNGTSAGSTDPIDPTQRVSCANTTRISVYECGTVNQYGLTQYNVKTVRASVADLGLYAETDWKARQNLTVSYGIRYEAQNRMHDPASFAPRVSFAWGVGSKKGSPVTVIRGGFGIFYSRFGLGNVLTPLENDGFNTISYNVENPGPGCTPSTPGDCTLGTGTGGNSLTKASPNLHNPYNLEYQLSDEIQPLRGVRLALSYIHTNGVQQYFTYNATPPANGIATPTTKVTNVYQSGGTFRQDQVNLTANITQKWLTLFGYTSFGWAKGDTNGFGTYPTNNALGIYSNWGRAPFDVRNRTSLGGNVTLPHNISLSPFVQFRTGSPYSVTVGQDLNGDSIYNDRPRFATDSDPSSAIKKIDGCGSFVAPAVGDTTYTPVPINLCTAPNLFATNLRLSKTFGFGARTAPRPGRGGPGGPGGGPGGPGGFGGGRGGRGGGGGGGRGANTGRRYNLTLSAQISNLFNDTNYSAPQSSMASAAFGIHTQLAGQPFGSSSSKQRTMLQMNFSF